MSDNELSKFQVWFYDRKYRHFWTAFYMAENFAHAEEQAQQDSIEDEIVKIEKDYE